MTYQEASDSKCHSRESGKLSSHGIRGLLEPRFRCNDLFRNTLKEKK